MAPHILILTPRDCFLTAGSNVLPIHISQTMRNEIWIFFYSFIYGTETASACLPVGGGWGGEGDCAQLPLGQLQ